MNESKYGRKTSFISLINVAGALHKSKGITNQSYKPCLVLKAVFKVSSSLTRTWLVVSQFEIQLGEVLGILQLV